MLSIERTRRIKDAIAECDSFIKKEGCRNPELRPAEAQQHLDFCVSHRAKLIKMIA